MTDFRVVPLGDSCLSIVFEEKIDRAVNARCIAVAEALEGSARQGIRDIVPVYHTVAVYFDPLKIGPSAIEQQLRLAADSPSVSATADIDSIEIPVEYGGAEGPDLASVAAFARCSEAEVIRLHTVPTYHVYMLGFLPGFAYLGTVDERIAMPRLDAPRLNVPAGSVGIAGLQTGVYPCNTPGGWRLLGRTRIKPFDQERPQPSLFRPGQRVRFAAVER